MEADSWCYYNGDLIKYKDFFVHVSDLGLQRSYGVFDFFRVRNGELTWLSDYTNRLFRSASLAELDLDLSQTDFTRIINDLHRKNSLENGAFKVIVTGGTSENLATVSGKPAVMILNVLWNRPPQETFDKGVQLLSYNYARPEPEIKTLNYFHTLHLRKKMKAIGAVDLMYYDRHILEASRANLFLVKNGEVFTADKGILFGITRKQVFGLLGNVTTMNLPYEELYSFDEVFMSSTSRDITPIVGVDGKKIGNGKPGPVTREVQSSFKKRNWMQ